MGKKDNLHFGFNNINMFAKPKRAQLTLFIILAIAIVAILLVIFYPRIKTIFVPSAPQNYVAGCVEDAAGEVLEKIALQGGALEPENYILYENNKIEYACYTNEYLKKCVMQKPFLKQDIEQEIKAYVEPRADACVKTLKQNLEKGGATVTTGDIDTEVLIIPGAIQINVNADMKVTKESTSSYKTFKGSIKSGLYNLLMISSSIANWEARYGEAESLTYMLYYPNIKVEKKAQGEGSTIYILTDNVLGDKFQFASRSLVFPEGYA